MTRWPTPRPIRASTTSPASSRRSRSRPPGPADPGLRLPAQGCARQVPDQLRLGRHRHGDPLQPPRRRPDARLPELRLRGVLPDPLHGGRNRRNWWTSRPTPAWRPSRRRTCSTSCSFLKNGDARAVRRPNRSSSPPSGPKATKAFYPGDPANINHSYIGDFVKFRNTHNGFEQHVFHLHNHQWLFNPNDDNSNYIDAQGIGPGMGYTYEIANGGSGNRNKSSGDAIYHCHFYPHFAQGMWYMWRIPRRDRDRHQAGGFRQRLPHRALRAEGRHARRRRPCAAGRRDRRRHADARGRSAARQGTRAHARCRRDRRRGGPQRRRSWRHLRASAGLLLRRHRRSGRHASAPPTT